MYLRGKYFPNEHDNRFDWVDVKELCFRHCYWRWFCLPTLVALLDLRHSSGFLWCSYLPVSSLIELSPSLLGIVPIIEFVITALLFYFYFHFFLYKVFFFVSSSFFVFCCLRKRVSKHAYTPHTFLSATRSHAPCPICAVSFLSYSLIVTTFFRRRANIIFLQRWLESIARNCCPSSSSAVRWYVGCHIVTPHSCQFSQVL